MPSRTLTGSYTSFAVSANSYTLTNLGTVGSNAVGTGLAISGTADTVVNAGTLSGENYAVTASQGLSLTNQTGGRISGIAGSGIDIYGAPGSVTNAGVITGLTQGVELEAGGYVDNQSGGAITGSFFYGVLIEGGAGTVTNAGHIAGGSDGIALNDGGTVINSGSIAGQYAVYLAVGGVITNQSSGTINGHEVGIEATTAASTIDNTGSIHSQYTGIALEDGGAVSNAHGGTITANVFDGIDISGAAGTVINAGYIAGNFGGVVLEAGGVVTNQWGGTIVGGGGGITFLDTAAAVSNAGYIDGQYAGVGLFAGGTVTNLTCGVIQSATYGVFAKYAGITVTNAGSISGGTDAVRLAAGYANRLIVDPGASFTGTVTGGNTVGATAVSTLELATGATTGTLSGLGTQFIDFSYITVDAGAIWTIAGTAGAGTTLANAGWIQSTVTLGAGSVVTNEPTGTISGTADGIDLTDGGTVTNQSGGTIGSSLTGLGIDVAGAAGTVINAGVIAGGQVGVNLLVGGTVTNQGGGTISNASIPGIGIGIAIIGGAATVSNAGAVYGTRDGLYADQGLDLTNLGTGAITGSSQFGVYVIAGSGMLTNAGTITGGSDGIVMADGGSVTNQSGGTIASGAAGSFAIAIAGAPGTVSNAGAVYGAIDGLDAHDGLNLTNLGTGAITGASRFGVYVLGGVGMLTNAGGITGGSDGIVLAHGGSVTNQSGATIASGGGGSFGISVANAAATVSNAGTIEGQLSSVYLLRGGTVTNQDGGSIVGTARDGVQFTGGAGTVVNAGSVAGATNAVLFDAGYTNWLVISPGATFSGTVDGGNTIGSTIVSTLELASGASAGTLTGLGSQYINFAQITIDAGAAWTWTGTNTIVAGATLTELGGASFLETGTLQNDGTIVLDPSTLTVATLTGSGLVTIDAGSTLEAQGTVAGGETLAFAGSGATLHFDTPDSVTGSVTNFGPGETIDLKRIDPASVSYAGGTLSFSGGSFALSLADGGTVAASPGADGALVSVLCFCAGTRIMTPTGELPVETLAVGDLVTTSRGEVRPLVWIGTGQVMVTRGHRSAATPVIVRRGALADNVPNRDLHVTKGHSLLIDDVLIPVEFLVNHRSIEWDDQAQQVRIYHLETATHEVLVANGAPAESYRDDGNRWLFRNASTGCGQPPKPPCAPVLTGGPIVDAIWRRLLDRCGARPPVPLTEDPDLHLLLDGVRLNARWRRGASHEFILPRKPGSLRVVSRAGSPAELGLAREPRLLGVAIRSIEVWSGARPRVMEAADPALTEGFHDFEADHDGSGGFRWTNGDALLPAALIADMRARHRLVLQVECTTRYPVFAEVPEQAAA